MIERWPREGEAPAEPLGLPVPIGPSGSAGASPSRRFQPQVAADQIAPSTG